MSTWATASLEYKRGLNNISFYFLVKQTLLLPGKLKSKVHDNDRTNVINRQGHVPVICTE